MSGDDGDMTRYRGAVLLVGAWLVVVTGGAVLTWAVISRAGDGVAGPPVVAASTPRTSPAPSDGATGRPQPSPSSPPPATSPTPSTPSTPPTSPGTTAPVEPVRRTWQGEGGVVVAECTGPTVRLVGAQPASGWKVEVDDTGPNRVRVEFEGSDERTRVRVEAGCAGGAPAFSVDVDGED